LGCGAGKELFVSAYPIAAGLLGGSLVLFLLRPKGLGFLPIIVADVRDIFNEDDKRERMMTFFLIGLCWTVCVAVAITAANIVKRFIPIEQRVNHIETVEKVVKIKQVFIPTPSDVKYPPLTDPAKACSGAPVVITSLDVSHSQADDKGMYTWLTVRPAGDAYTVQCNMGGDYSGSWHVGDLVSLPSGKVTG
jgi:hypothetical protein